MPGTAGSGINLVCSINNYPCGCGNPRLPYGNRLNEAQTECYCKFLDEACEFDKYECSNIDYSVALTDTNNHLNGGLTIRLDVVQKKYMSCNIVYKGTMKLAYTGKVVVCG
jgi:hypothetical protein